MKRIRIFDTTLRDGEQSPGCSMNLTEKIEMARQLEKLGVDVIEAGLPLLSHGPQERADHCRRCVQLHRGQPGPLHQGRH